MTTPDNDVGAEASAVAARLRKLVSLNEPANGGPYRGYAAEQFIATAAEAAALLEQFPALVARTSTEPMGLPQHVTPAMVGAYARRKRSSLVGFPTYAHDLAENAWQAFLSCLPTAPPTVEPAAVAVKPLEWQKYWAGTDENVCAWRAIGFGASGLTIWMDDLNWFTGTCENGKYANLDEAKAAKQADYEARIRSALVDPLNHKDPGVKS